MGWLVTLPLRLKLWGLGLGALLLAFGGLYARYRVVKADAQRSAQRAQALQAARQAQMRVITKTTELRERQRQLRAQIMARTERDGLDGQGWGP